MVLKTRQEFTGSKPQCGQALVYGLFVLAGGLAALFFLFNTGQLSAEKTKLVNTADAVAYSAGVMHARTLNFEAYTNRAMIANTVAIAQLVSLSSWVQYVNSLGGIQAITLLSPKFKDYYESYQAALQIGPEAYGGLIKGEKLKGLAEGADTIIQSLKAAQAVAYAGLIPARLKLMDEVAQANYRNGRDGKVAVDEIPLTVNEFASFVSRYSADQRTRFAEVAKAAVHQDGFVEKRGWLPLAGIFMGRYADCPGATVAGRKDFLTRRGGTELLGFDEWKAMDTLEEKRWVPKSKGDVACQAILAVPNAWGGQDATTSSAIDLNPTHYDSSPLVNTGASLLATMDTSSWKYSGLPSFYELSDAVLQQGDPRLKFAIRVRRDKSETATSEARSNIKNAPAVRANAYAPGLNQYRAKPAVGPIDKKEFVAVSASEVFFARPDTYSDRENQYGKKELGKPNEIGSLFNPYWQVHLVYSEEDVKKAQAMQGVALP